jgi:hypothetical protein
MPLIAQKAKGTRHFNPIGKRFLYRSKPTSAHYFSLAVQKSGSITSSSSNKKKWKRNKMLLFLIHKNFTKHANKKYLTQKN